MPINNTVVGMLAHVDAGKTTLSEQLLYRAGVLRRPGRVDDRDALLDHDDMERRRGITIFSDQAELSFEGRPFTLVDTPGHGDFSGEMERALSVLDCAVLVVSAAEGVQAHTETLWRLLRERSVPIFVFLNKTDRAGAEPDRVMKELARMGGTGFCDLTEGLSEEGKLSRGAIEALAEMDDELMEAYFGEKLDHSFWLEKARDLLAHRRLFPVFRGSALKGEGVDGLLRGLRLLAPASGGSPEAPFAGMVYKIRHDKGGRVAYLKVLQGVLHPRDVIETASGGEKCSELRSYSGEKFQPLPEAGPGTLCAVTGLQKVRAGELVGAGAGERTAFALRPLLASQVLFDREALSPMEMLAHFRELEDEEPLLAVSWNEQVQEIQVQVMGEIQLEVLTEMVRTRWGVEISFAPCSVLYRETLAAPVVGVGHFEPLRHYAEVHLRLIPAPRGSGISFRSECHQDSLLPNWQNLIATHVLEKQHKGVLMGAPLTDVEIVLLSGRAHLKHTEGGDFREATYRAVRQGLMHGKSLLLEPYYEVEITCALEEIGRVQTDLARLSAACGAPREESGTMRLHARGPVRTLMEYPREFGVMTRGRGRISLRFGGYEPCQEQERLAAESGYDPERDLENTPDSVFCAHGAGYPVKWSEAPAHMHLPVEPDAEEPAEQPQEEEQSREVQNPAPSVLSGGLEQDRELLAIFERAYGSVSRRELRPQNQVQAEERARVPVPERDMGPEYLLVDGYNVIFAWEELKAIAQTNLDAARQLLTDMLSNYQGFRQNRVILVFDAYRVPRNTGEVVKYENIYVVYTREAQTADAYIEKATYTLSQDNRVRVVSSDGTEQIIVLGHGALRVSAMDFKRELESAQGQIRELISREAARLPASSPLRLAMERARREKQEGGEGGKGL